MLKTMMVTMTMMVVMTMLMTMMVRKMVTMLGNLWNHSGGVVITLQSAQRSAKPTRQQVRDGIRRDGSKRKMESGEWRLLSEMPPHCGLPSCSKCRHIHHLRKVHAALTCWWHNISITSFTHWNLPQIPPTANFNQIKCYIMRPTGSNHSRASINQGRKNLATRNCKKCRKPHYPSQLC